MLGIDDRLVVADDGVDILEEDDPRHDGMRKAGLGGFFMVLAEVTGGVKELFWNDGSFQTDFRGGIRNRFAANTRGTVPPIKSVLESFARASQTRVAPSHYVAPV